MLDIEMLEKVSAIGIMIFTMLLITTMGIAFVYRILKKIRKNKEDNILYKVLIFAVAGFTLFFDSWGIIESVKIFNL
ncbi:MAG: hypothetical protein ACRCUS_06230 [Anaerovoracaceae bacterium]